MARGTRGHEAADETEFSGAKKPATERETAAGIQGRNAIQAKVENLMGPTFNAGSSAMPGGFSSNMLHRNGVTSGERAGRQGCD